MSDKDFDFGDAFLEGLQEAVARKPSKSWITTERSHHDHAASAGPSR